jgi:hypothetical protein
MTSTITYTRITSTVAQYVYTLPPGVVPDNALLNEDGNPILNEDGNYILVET